MWFVSLKWKEEREREGKKKQQGWLNSVKAMPQEKATYGMEYYVVTLGKESKESLEPLPVGGVMLY